MYEKPRQSRQPSSWSEDKQQTGTFRQVIDTEEACYNTQDYKARDGSKTSKNRKRKIRKFALNHKKHSRDTALCDITHLQNVKDSDPENHYNTLMNFKRVE